MKKLNKVASHNYISSIKKDKVVRAFENRNRVYLSVGDHKRIVNNSFIFSKLIRIFKIKISAKTTNTLNIAKL